MIANSPAWTPQQAEREINRYAARALDLESQNKALNEQINGLTTALADRDQKIAAVNKLHRIHVLGADVLKENRCAFDLERYPCETIRALTTNPIDGLVTAGVLPDDNADHLLLTIFRIGVQIQCVHNPARHVHLRLIVSEVTG